LLGLPDPAASGFLDGKLTPKLNYAELCGSKDVAAHYVPRRVVQNQCDEVKPYHRLQLLGEVAEQGSEVTVRGNRFRDCKEGLVLGNKRIGG
jgi:hypothetical protein